MEVKPQPRIQKKSYTTFNEKMNKKNIYFNNPPSFKLLAEKYENFRRFVFMNKYGDYSINWKCKEAMKELCRTLLEEDFQIKYWNIPDGYLIPSITSRCNYIHWIHDLLEESLIIDIYPTISGLDIGVGANCIYPLLGNSIYKWKFTCSDININSIEISKDIIFKNNLKNQIQILLQPNEESYFKNIILENQVYQFSMCNPPYFDIRLETKKNNPHTVIKILILGS
jgi:23S rRNA (adenine1618-N6)-methyltransferase